MREEEERAGDERPEWIEAAVSSDSLRAIAGVSGAPYEVPEVLTSGWD